MSFILFYAVAQRCGLQGAESIIQEEGEGERERQGERKRIVKKVGYSTQHSTAHNITAHST
jgi:hypothetical protein